jgi:hypothetical protein
MKVITPKSIDGCYDVFHVNSTTYIICPYDVKLNVDNSKELICPHKHVRIYYVSTFEVTINGKNIVPNLYNIPTKDIAVSTLEKNSSKLLYHWLTYHSSIGADFFFIYDNNSSEEEFEKIVEICKNFDGIIFRWNYPYGYDGPTQQTQQNHTLYLSKNKITRIILTDLDEYIVPYENANFKSVIMSNKVVYLWWLWFGSDGVEEITDPRYYTKCSKAHESQWYHKMIVDPLCVDLVSAHNVLLPISSHIQAFYPTNILLHHYIGLSFRKKCVDYDKESHSTCKFCVRYNYQLSNVY